MHNPEQDAPQTESEQVAKVWSETLVAMTRRIEFLTQLCGEHEERIVALETLLKPSQKGASN